MRHASDEGLASISIVCSKKTKKAWYKNHLLLDTAGRFLSKCLIKFYDRISAVQTDQMVKKARLVSNCNVLNIQLLFVFFWRKGFSFLSFQR